MPQLRGSAQRAGHEHAGSQHAGPQQLGYQRLLRIACAVLAVGLAVGAVWLIVTAKTTKNSQIGALLGSWSLLMAAFSGLGPRGARVAEAPGAEVDLRPSAELDRPEDAERRLHFERQLLQMVRSEIAATLGPEIANIRADVAALRNEILETVGGQIRLERIETTRMIGSDLEALQRELRQLRTASVEVTAPPIAAAASYPADAAPQRAPQRVPQVSWPDQPADISQGTAAESAHDDSAHDDSAHDDSAHDYDEDDDLFAMLPRITSYSDADSDAGAFPGQESYAGRRRADESAPGRHAAAEGWAGALPRRSAGGRRRRNDDGDDVLARILQREAPRH